MAWKENSSFPTLYPAWSDEIGLSCPWLFHICGTGRLDSAGGWIVASDCDRNWRKIWIEIQARAWYQVFSLLKNSSPYFLANLFIRSDNFQISFYDLSIWYYWSVPDVSAKSSMKSWKSPGHTQISWNCKLGDFSIYRHDRILQYLMMITHHIRCIVRCPIFSYVKIMII